MDLVKSFADFRQQIFSNPSPWFGGILSGLITAGIFGWITHLRGVRPVLVFLYKHGEGWYLKNIGVGPAINVVVADAGNDKKWVEPTLYYPIAKDDQSSLMGIVRGEYLRAEYTDVNGHLFSTECGFNKNRYANHWVKSLPWWTLLGPTCRRVAGSSKFEVILRNIGELEAVKADPARTNVP